MLPRRSRLKEAYEDAWRVFRPPEAPLPDEIGDTVPPGTYIVGHECNGGTREFQAFKNAATFFSVTELPAGGLFHIIVGNQPRRVYFDFDWVDSSGNYYDIFPGGWTNLFTRVLGDFCATRGLDFSENDLVFTTGTRPGKVSFHVLLKTAYWKDGPSSKAWTREFSAYVAERHDLTPVQREALFDRVVYGATSQNWRIYGSYKLGKPAGVLRPSGRTGFFRCTLEEFLEEHTATAVDFDRHVCWEPEGPVEVAVPRLIRNGVRAASVLPPEIMERVAAALGHPVDELTSTPRRSAANLSFYGVHITASAAARGIKMRCPSRPGAFHKSNGMMVVVDHTGAVRMRCWMAHCIPQGQTKPVWHSVYNPGNFEEVFHRTFDSRYVSDCRDLVDEVDRAVWGAPQVIGISSPPGTGKTTLLKRLLNRQPGRPTTPIVVIIVPRVALANDISRRLGVRLYSELPQQIMLTDHVVICPRSLRRITIPGNMTRRLVIVIDELLTTIDFLTAPIMHPRSMDRLWQLADRAQAVIGLEAFWNPACNLLLQGLLREGTPVVFENITFPPLHRELIRYCSQADFEAAFQDRLRRPNHKVFVCCKTVALAEAMGQIAEAEGVSYRVYSSRHSAAPTDVDTEWCFLKCVIITTKVGVGVDCSRLEFGSTFILAEEGHGPNAKDIMQMVLRTRECVTRELHAFLPIRSDAQPSVTPVVLDERFDLLREMIYSRAQNEEEIEIMQVRHELMTQLRAMVTNASMESEADLFKALKLVAGRHIKTIRTVSTEDEDGQLDRSRSGAINKIKQDEKKKTRLTLTPQRIQLLTGWTKLSLTAERLEVFQCQAIGKVDVIETAALMKPVLDACGISVQRLKAIYDTGGDECGIELPLSIPRPNGWGHLLSVLQSSLAKSPTDDVVDVRALKIVLRSILGRMGLGFQSLTRSTKRVGTVKIYNIRNAFNQIEWAFVREFWTHPAEDADAQWSFADDRSLGGSTSAESSAPLRDSDSIETLLDLIGQEPSVPPGLMQDDDSQSLLPDTLSEESFEFFP